MKPKRFSNRRTVEFLRKHGYMAESVEKFIYHIRKYRDLYRMFDVVAMKPQEGILFIQCTEPGGLSTRRDGLLERAELAFCLESKARVQLWSWREVVGRPRNIKWEPRIEEAFFNEVKSPEFRIVPLPGKDPESSTPA